MGKFIIRRCHSLANSFYADGKEEVAECAESTADEKCCAVKDCYLKEIVESLLRVVSSNLCERCDGCGYYAGCKDESCGTYAAYKCLDLLDVEFVEE